MLSWRSANDHHAMFCPWHILPRLTSEAETLCGKDLEIEHLQLWVLRMAVVWAWSLQRRWRKPVLPCFSHMKVPAGWFPTSEALANLGSGIFAIRHKVGVRGKVRSLQLLRQSRLDGPEVVGFDWLGDVGALFTTCAGVPDFIRKAVVDPTKQAVPLKVQVLPCHRLAPGGAATAGANLLVSARRLLALAPALALSKARIPRHS